MIVVDASVAVRWVADEPEAQQATELLDRDDLIAPSLLVVEVTSALARKVRAGELSKDQALDGLELVFDRVDIRQASFELMAASLSLSLELKHTLYDCTYVALTEAVSGQLATHDDELVRRVRRSGRGQLLLPLGTA